MKDFGSFLVETITNKAAMTIYEELCIDMNFNFFDKYTGVRLLSVFIFFYKTLQPKKLIEGRVYFGLSVLGG